MSEITKLYENAGVEKEVIKGCYEYYTEYWGIDIYTINDCKNKDCNTCEADKSVKEYPPFTAEKQLKIMELLGEVHTFFDADKTNFACIANHRIEKGIIKGYEGKGESVSEALASLINNLWQDLTPEDKTSIKNILEM